MSSFAKLYELLAVSSEASSSPLSQLSVDSCYQAKDKADLGVGLFLTIGTIVTYIPQVVELLIRRTSVGISAWMIFVMNLSGYMNAISATLLDFDREVCCTKVNFWQCNEGLLDQWLVAANVIMGIPIYILYVIFLYKEKSALERKKGYGLFLFFSIFFVISIVITAIMMHFQGYLAPSLQTYGKVQGILSDIGSAIVWTPQIYHTFKLKSPGSLSLTMLFLQAPGALIVVVFLILQKEAFYVWLPYFVSGVTQGTLFIEGTYYLILEKRREWLLKKKGNVQSEENKGLLEDSKTS